MRKRRSTYELGAILVAGVAHILTELFQSAQVASLFNVAVSIAFLGYVLLRILLVENQHRDWGMRMDNFFPALRIQSAFVIPAVIGIVIYGLIFGSLRLPASFWLTMVLYPVWGIAQQFALQNLIARNLSGIFSNAIVLALVASLLFCGAHIPRLPLVVLTLVAGFFFTLLYRREPNIWAVGIVHGLLGALIFYVVLQEDPGGAILQHLGFAR
jgi:membrane protease YdiL (CAAX protease family)